MIECKKIFRHEEVRDLLARAVSLAHSKGWTSDAIDVMLKEAMSGDYNNLLDVICKIELDKITSVV